MRTRTPELPALMNILMVTGIFPPDLGGPARYVPRMAQALVERGHLVEVVTLSDSTSHDDGQYPFAVRRIRRGLFRPWRLAATVWRIWRSAQECDLLYVNGLGFEAGLASLLALRPSVHKVVGDYAWERAMGRGWYRGSLEAFQGVRKNWKCKLACWVRTLPLLLAGAVVVPSRYLRGIVAGWGVGADKLRVIYNAVEAQHQCAKEPLPHWKGKTVVTVCRLVPWKGVEALIGVLAQLPQTRLVIVGDGPLRGQLETEVLGLGLQERVHFLGSVPQEQVRACIGQGDAFVLNSSYEGLPHVVLEAMEAGVPVVATAAGGTVELVEHDVSGLLVPVGDGAALRRALERLWQTPALGANLVQGARRALARQFGFQEMVNSTERVLLEKAEPGRWWLPFAKEQPR